MSDHASDSSLCIAVGCICDFSWLSRFIWGHPVPGPVHCQLPKRQQSAAWRRKAEVERFPHFKALLCGGDWYTQVSQSVGGFAHSFAVLVHCHNVVFSCICFQWKSQINLLHTTWSAPRGRQTIDSRDCPLFHPPIIQSLNRPTNIHWSEIPLIRFPVILTMQTKYYDAPFSSVFHPMLSHFISESSMASDLVLCRPLY